MSNRLARMLPILLGIGLMAGCGSRELIVLLPSEEGKTGRLAVSNEDGNTVVLDSPLAAAEVDGSGTASAVSLSTLSLRNAFGAMPSAMPKAPISYVVYFKFSTVALTDESQRELHTALADLRERAGAEVEVIGHTDGCDLDLMFGFSGVLASRTDRASPKIVATDLGSASTNVDSIQSPHPCLSSASPIGTSAV